MKKYILYDNKVYEIKVNEKYKKEGVANYYYIQTSPHTRLLFEKDDIKQCKQADNIEELCEEFVWVWNKNEFPYSCYRQHIRYAWGDLLRNIRSEENYGKYLNNDYEIYGATWTDKGLIYIAKLNDKGKLELI